ncbi:MAG: FeoA family protein [bacterium]|jgi:Fe2+ transport system protein FeoA
MRRRKMSVVRSLNIMDGGTSGRIIDIMATGPTRHRILSLGLVEGTNIMVKGRNPLKKSVSIFVRDRNLELQEELAQNVRVLLDI